MRIGVAAGSATVSWTPLALTLGLHLLLVLAWLMRPGAPFVMPAALARETVLVMVTPPAPRTPAPLPRPVLRESMPKAARPLIPPITQSIRRPVLPQPAPEQPAATEPVESELVQSAPAPAAIPGDWLAASKSMARRIGAEAGQDSKPIGAEPERKWERFADTVGAARRSGSMGGTLDSHTAGDGVVTYRKTVGLRVRCYRSGSVGGIGPADGQTAGNVACPTGVRWNRL